MIHIFMYVHKPEVNGETFFKYCKKKKKNKLSAQSSIPPENLFQKWKRKKKMKEKERYFQTFSDFSYKKC